MKSDPRASRPFSERLRQAERFGMIMIRDVCAEEMKCCGSDVEKLVDLAFCIGELSGEACMRENIELSAIYDVIYDEIVAYVRNLGKKEYHLFCESVSFRGAMRHYL